MRPQVTDGGLPGSDIVQVWLVSLGAPPVASLAALLSEEECERAARFVFERDRRQFVAVRGRLRQLLGEYLNRSPRDLRFALGSHGKPVLADGDDGLHFNVSHSGDVGVLAFCRGREIGVDVERIDAGVGIDDLAENCFSLAEQESFRPLRGSARAERFFQLWAAKEACIKAIGRGLSIPLQDFAVDVRSDTDIWTVAKSGETNESMALWVQRIPVPFGYAGAVAAIGSGWQVHTRDLAPD